MGMINIYINRHVQNRTKEMNSYYILISMIGLQDLFNHRQFHIHFASLHSWLRFSHDVVVFIPEE